ncbi:WUSCHEL-related homeobox 11-like [Malania oleifera]|uniref:WUSCHEL-related homeobox 11-like n=1 Tax=Malania oleifera TaxID=397392 RepID=UPI0025ADEBCF|nr:WUSCHEL-related homeobox 11-like [Malania oleifera]
MEDQAKIPNSTPPHASERSEPVRSRWSPKPEQILILESIFNSGMVNPSRDETVRIRDLLEKFGPVSDANVFYWFQNRRSRFRRQQRQIQTSITGDQTGAHPRPAGGVIHYEGSTSSSSAIGFQITAPHSFPLSLPYSCLAVGSSSSSARAAGHDGTDGLFSASSPMGFPEIDQSSFVSLIPCPLKTSNLHCQPTGFITVFINRVPTNVPRGPLDVKAMFGEDVVLFHSSGVPVSVNEFGFSAQSLQHGESYFLV